MTIEVFEMMALPNTQGVSGMVLNASKTDADPGSNAEERVEVMTTNNETI